MKNFKDFISEEKPNIKRKAKGEQDFVDAHEVEVTDPENSGTEGPAKVNTKAGSGKRKADKDNKQEFGEEVEEIDESTGQQISAKMMKSKTMKPFAAKVSKMAKVTRADLEKMLPDYVSGAEITKLFKEEVEEIDEVSKELLARYAKSATVDARMSQRTAKDFERHELKSRKPEYKAGAKEWKDKYQERAWKRQAGVHKAIDRLAKEEVELDEEQLIEMDAKDLPFTPDKPKKNPPAKAGKYGQGHSTAKHLAKMGMKKAQKGFGPSPADKLSIRKEENIDEIAPAIAGAIGRAVVGAAIKSGVKKAVSSVSSNNSKNESAYTNPGLEKLAQQKKTLRQKKKSMQEADFSKKETKMAHTIGKEFEKKGVGDESKGGPYAVASAMVRDKPEAAKKAYKTIQSKMKEEADAELLFNLYNDLNEENQEMFMSQLEEDADSLLEFARMMEEE